MTKRKKGRPKKPATRVLSKRVPASEYQELKDRLDKLVREYLGK